MPAPTQIDLQRAACEHCGSREVKAKKFTSETREDGQLMHENDGLYVVCARCNRMRKDYDPVLTDQPR